MYHYTHYLSDRSAGFFSPERMIPPMPALLPTGRSQQQAEGRWEYVGYRDQQQVDLFHYYQSKQVNFKHEIY